VASVRLEQELAPERLTRALNGVLPRDIGVRSVGIAADDFDALRSAGRKRYRYQLWNAPERSPLRAKRFAHIPRPLDVAAMQRAAASLCGEHDFSSFRAAGSQVKTSVRTIFSLALTGEPGGEIRVAIEGSGFLRHMVRNIVGTLIEVGHGRRAADSMEALLAARDRDLAGPTAPACGLTLEAVMYSDPGVGRVAAGVASIGHSTGKTPA
jgi:tRNA pseudouridine38-40 synthase